MMHNVRRQIWIFMTLAILAVSYLAVSIRSNYLATTQFAAQIEESLNWQNTAWRWLNERPKIGALEEAKKQIDRLEPEHRRVAIRQMVIAVEERSNGFKGKVEFVDRTEAEAQRYFRGQHQAAADRIVYFSSLMVLLILSTFVALSFHLNKNVFRPLKSLSRKMTDFLNDRYTYQFSIPAPNEIGHLQATFNSLAQRVLRTMEELTTLDHAKSEFLSIASHELRTPLTSIKGSLSLMKSGVVGPMNEMTQNLLNIAEAETDRLIRLINELLDLAKIESGKFQIQPQWRPVDALIGRTFQSLSGLAQTAQIQLTHSDLPSVHAYMDTDCVQQVLTNLLSNAIKFSPKGSKVEVHVDIDANQHLLFQVRDHGKGIAPEDQELIFQKFRQATSAKNPLVKGTGLGLAIAKALVEEHGGTIGVQSKPDEGSTFYFTLPKWQFVKPEQPKIHDTMGVAA